MMDYEGIVRASARVHQPKTRAPGAMGVVDLGRGQNAPAQQQQQQGQAAPAAPRAEQRPQFGAAPYPTPMAMR